ncbi:MAG: GntR family transcriptional regulator [Thermaerobacter sp.]|nr:GntR family transcriptional regulator [Thermaerobacter sp.]
MIKTVVEQIRLELRRRVLVGTWSLGTRLFEEEIAQDFDVSRSAVREAVRLLEQEGLLVRTPHRGLYVASPSGRDTLEVAQMRAILEASAVRYSPPPTAATLRELERICQRFDVIRDSDHLEAVNLDRTFHGLIAAESVNRLLLLKFHELDGHIAIFFHWVTAHVPGRLEDIGARHRALMDAYAQGDPEIFRGAVTQHYEEAAAELVRHLPHEGQVARGEGQPG